MLDWELEDEHLAVDGQDELGLNCLSAECSIGSLALTALVPIVAGMSQLPFG